MALHRSPKCWHYRHCHRPKRCCEASFLLMTKLRPTGLRCGCGQGLAHCDSNPGEGLDLPSLPTGSWCPVGFTIKTCLSSQQQGTPPWLSLRRAENGSAFVAQGRALWGALDTVGRRKRLLSQDSFVTVWGHSASILTCCKLIYIPIYSSVCTG